MSRAGHLPDDRAAGPAAGTAPVSAPPSRAGPTSAFRSDATSASALPASSPLKPLPADAEIVRAVLQGETDLFGVLVQRHQNSLHRLAFSMVHDGDVALDLVQDAFIRAFSNLHQCRKPDRIRVWLLALLRNRTLDHLKERRRRDVPLDEAADATADRVPDALTSLSARTTLERALAALPETLREAFLLRHVEDMSYEDMAELLDTTLAGVKMRVSRARDALRRELEAAEGEPA
jgi:RNA polymerase sigma-70 factor, ECF subfamily